MLLAAGCTVVGFAIGVILSRNSTRTLTRAPHIALWSLLFAAASAINFAALLIDQAVERGILWVFLLIYFASVAMLGAIYGVISHSRAMDAYGSGRKAWFGIIPLIWFELAFRKSLHPMKSSFGRNILNGTICIVAFGQFLASKIADKKLEDMLEDQAQTASYSPAVITRATTGFIQSEGLERALQTVASTITPAQIDDGTSITTARVEGTTLTVHYALDPSVTDLPDAVRQDLVTYRV
jgi:hypothetical protein